MTNHRLAPRHLSIPLQDFADEIAPPTTLVMVQTIWEQAAGPKIANAAKPIKERDGVLTILCTAAVWAQEVDLMADQLIERVNEALGSQLVHALHCRSA
jgi:predicted nucleic acid-binding Zn ribbon protein